MSDGPVSDPLRCFEIRYNLLNLASEVIGLDPEESADSFNFEKWKVSFFSGVSYVPYKKRIF